MKETITRRSLLKQSTLFSLAVALKPLHLPFFRSLPKNAAGYRDLYLCCHGLFAFVFRDDHILLLTPRIGEHKYLAGSWRREAGMKRGGAYSLLLGSKSAPANPRPVIGADNLHLPAIKDIDVNGSHCQIKLPFPKRFISLRHVTAEFEGESFATANAPSARFPLLQVLHYEVPDIQNCKLEGFEESWKPDRHSASQQLHMFAEPPDLVPDDHAARAFDALVQMLPGVDLRLKSSPKLAPCPVREPGSPPEIDLEQELSLAERNGLCVAQMKRGGKPVRKDRGPQPPNCFSVIVGP